MSKGIDNIKFDYESIGKILKSSEVMGICETYANKYNGDNVRKFIGFDRCHIFVYVKEDK